MLRVRPEFDSKNQALSKSLLAESSSLASSSARLAWTVVEGRASYVMSSVVQHSRIAKLMK
jgi:hypothetical protein